MLSCAELCCTVLYCAGFAPGAALRDMWHRAASAGTDRPACSIRDFDIVNTLGHGDYGSVFEVGRWWTGLVMTFA